jgi:hypothetical protein
MMVQLKFRSIRNVATTVGLLLVDREIEKRGFHCCFDIYQLDGIGITVADRVVCFDYVVVAMEWQPLEKYEHQTAYSTENGTYGGEVK